MRDPLASTTLSLGRPRSRCAWRSLGRVVAIGSVTLAVAVASASTPPPAAPPATTQPTPPPAQPPATPPATPPTEPPPATQPAPTSPPATVPTTAPAIAPSSSRSLTPRPGEKPRRIYVIEDKFSEFYGIVRAEEDDRVILEQVGGKLREFYRSRVLEIIELVEPEPGQPGVVYMRDGRSYSGTIISDNYDGVEIEIKGIKQRLARRDVHHVTLTLTPRQFYEKARKEIGADQFTDRMRLARYLFNKKMYLEAREELISLLQVIDLHEAKELLRTVEAQLSLQNPVPPSVAPEMEPPPGALREDNTGKGPVRFLDTLPDRLLTDEDVNLIRVYEIDFHDPPRVTVSPDTIRELIEKYADSELIPENAEARSALFRAEPIRIVRLMFDLKARELYPKIEVTSEPHALALFRQRIHNTWLIGNCATSRCHGGVDAGRFFLHTKDHKSDRVRYTNLLILERLRIPGKPPLIDWEKPTDSLLIQYGLPRDVARYPHPDVKGWEPVFTRITKRLIDDFAAWCKAMYQPRPDYPVEYEPPQLVSPDEPETQIGDEPDRVPR
ncbi:MAG: hypothetical protein JNM94_19095 [Phycisphaerae bacterium]|nr:hypothetical protein [Phycisphaerae bacterium]